MDIFMKVLGGLIALFFIYVGVAFTFKPISSIQSLQRRRYGSAGDPQPRQIMMTRIFGIIIVIIGLYFLVSVGLSILYPVAQ